MVPVLEFLMVHGVPALTRCQQQKIIDEPGESLNAFTHHAALMCEGNHHPLMHQEGEGTCSYWCLVLVV